MSYLALYRKYRPQKFEEIVGQKYIVKVLKNSIKHNMISHAYLFSGPRGTGKTTTAKLIAKLINCENPINNEPCEKCNSCIAFNSKNHPDIIEMDAASNNGVDEIREIRDKISLMPAISKYKVYIIDEVHMLSTGAFNALLKTLEEPPKHVIFILATTELSKVPATIISRCQCFDFEKISIDNIVKELIYIVEKENISIDDQVLPLIAKYSDGGLRDAINMLDKLACCSDNITLEDFYDLRGLVKQEDLENLYNNIVNGDINKTLDKISNLESLGKNSTLLVDELINYLKVLIVNKYKNNDDYSLSEEHMFEIIDILISTSSEMKQSTNSTTLFEIGILKIINIVNNEKIDFHTLNNVKSLDDNNNFTVINNFSAAASILKETKDNTEHKENEVLQENIKIRINNAFATADKNILENLKLNWSKFSDYLYNKEFGQYVSFLLDGTLRVAGENDLIISLKYDSILDNALLNISKIESLLSIVMGKYYKIAFILDKEWSILKERFINDKKNGIIYKYEPEENIDYTQLPKKEIKITENSDVINKAVSLFGNDYVEIK